MPQEGVGGGVSGRGLLLLEGCGRSIGERVDLWVDSSNRRRHDTRARLGTYPGRPRRCPAGGARARGRSAAPPALRHCDDASLPCIDVPVMRSGGGVRRVDAVGVLSSQVKSSSGSKRRRGRDRSISRRSRLFGLGLALLAIGLDRRSKIGRFLGLRTVHRCGPVAIRPWACRRRSPTRLPRIHVKHMHVERGIHNVSLNFSKNQ